MPPPIATQRPTRILCIDDNVDMLECLKSFLETFGWMMQSTCSILVKTDPECTRTMGYYDQRDIPYYYEVATQFATSDRFHSSALSGTIVHRSFLLAATAGGMNNPGDPFPAHAATIFRTLSEARISWRYYYQDDSVFLGYFSCGGSCDWDKYLGNVFPIDNYTYDA